MKTPRLYLDTSVLGGCFDPEFAPWSNGLVDDLRNGLFVPVLSEVVALEVARAPEPVQAVYTALLALDSEVLQSSAEAVALADLYVARGIVTAKYRGDALHIALATVSGVDLLVSWNFRHIVRFDRIRRFNAVSAELGYKPIQIHSPREVASYERKASDPDDAPEGG